MTGPGLPVARAVRRGPLGQVPGDAVLLTHDERLLRRRRLVTLRGEAFLADLPETVALDDGDALELGDGRLIGILAAEEDLMEVQGELHRLAWHIGNRHAPCQIEGDRLVLPRDRVMRAMLEGLGAVVRDIREPFRPEGGAYAAGRTTGHAHPADAAAARAESHSHAHLDGGHVHVHSHAGPDGHSHTHVHVHRHRARRGEDPPEEPGFDP